MVELARIYLFESLGHLISGQGYMGRRLENHVDYVVHNGRLISWAALRPLMGIELSNAPKQFGHMGRQLWWKIIRATKLRVEDAMDVAAIWDYPFWGPANWSSWPSERFDAEFGGSKSRGGYH